MSDWNPEKYLLFQRQRTQPAMDLASRLKGRAPKTVVDIGCGPGNSTAVLKRRFPNAHILGIDSSEAMVARAKEAHPDLSFSVTGAEALAGSYDLLFSNACLQWVEHHEQLLPQLMSHLNAGGALAVQMPMNREEPLFRIIDEVVSDPKWGFDTAKMERSGTLTPERYFDILTGCADAFDMWESVYYHALPSHEHLLEWVRGARLRPYLAALDEDGKRALEDAILTEAKAAYPKRESGEVVLKFRRFFFIAERKP